MTSERTHSISPETDDFAARYDRMVAGGPGRWVAKTIGAVIGILVVFMALGYALFG